MFLKHFALAKKGIVNNQKRLQMCIFFDVQGYSVWFLAHFVTQRLNISNSIIFLEMYSFMGLAPILNKL